MRLLNRVYQERMMCVLKLSDRRQAARPDEDPVEASRVKFKWTRIILGGLLSGTAFYFLPRWS